MIDRRLYLIGGAATRSSAGGHTNASTCVLESAPCGPRLAAPENRRRPACADSCFFSDLYYDPIREEWWALGDRGPGGGVLDYQTRVQKISLDVDRWTGRISRFRVLQTVKFTDPFELLSAPDSALAIARKRPLNGLNPLLLNSDAAELGRSFDPEGLVIDPRTGHLLVSDEYGPSLYEFDRKGRLIFVFETPANLVPRLNGTASYVAVRDDCAAPNTCLGRQDNRGFEGLAIGPRLKLGRYSIVTGNDNDFSVTQLGGALVQFETYVDFAGSYVRCPLGETTGCELNGNGVDEGDFTHDLPPGYRLLPGVLHAYRASASDLAGYVAPRRGRGHHDCDDDRPGR